MNILLIEMWKKMLNKYTDKIKLIVTVPMVLDVITDVTAGCEFGEGRQLANFHKQCNSMMSSSGSARKYFGFM